VRAIRVFRHLKSVFRLLVEAVRDARDVLLQDPVGVFFPVVFVEEAEIVFL